MTKDIVYKATVTTSNTNSTKYYIGMTASTFKERYRNHIKSFNHNLNLHIMIRLTKGIKIMLIALSNPQKKSISKQNLVTLRTATIAGRQ